MDIKSINSNITKFGNLRSSVQIKKFKTLCAEIDKSMLDSGRSNDYTLWLNLTNKVLAFRSEFSAKIKAEMVVTAEYVSKHTPIKRVKDGDKYKYIIDGKNKEFEIKSYESFLAEKEDEVKPIKPKKSDFQKAVDYLSKLSLSGDELNIISLQLRDLAYENGFTEFESKAS